MLMKMTCRKIARMRNLKNSNVNTFQIYNQVSQ